MSIYRDPHAPTSDIHAARLKTEERDGQWRPYSREAGPVTPAMLAMRKTMPSNALLEYTKQWTATLPETMRPQALLAEFPRIANMVALLWGEPTRTPLDEYMESLLVDRRGNRQGFPPSVVGDLLMLRTVYDERRQRR